MWGSVVSASVAISILILIVSTVLFAYWFRYTCVLILSTRANRSYARQVAEVNRLSFVAAQQQLADDSARKDALDRVHQSLDRDYRLVSFLLENAGLPSDQTLEERMLRLDYRIMRIMYLVSRPFSAASARQALMERASIISHLANTMGERVALTS